MSAASLVLAVMALIVSAHAAIHAATTGFYLRRIRSRVFDNPLPWYVRYADRIERGVDRTRTVLATPTPTTARNERHE